MTALLVSVRNAEEALAALAGGADLIDVKEPQRGALGAADPSEWRAVQQAIAGQAPLSVALGELHADPVAELAEQTAGFHYAKIGLAACAGQRHWQSLWQQAWERLPSEVMPVAVAYADWQQAHAPRPDQVLAAAVECGVRLLLVDTHEKRGGNLLTHWSLEQIQGLADEAAEKGVRLAIAGSVSLEILPVLLALAPAYIAVRGAACRGVRTARIDQQLVAELSARCRRGSVLAVGNF